MQRRQDATGLLAGPALIEPVLPAEIPPGHAAERHAQWFAEASELERAGRLPEAAQLLRQLLIENDWHVAAMNLLGIIAFRRGAPERAVALIEQAIALAPGEAPFHRNICEVYRTLGRYDEAVSAARRAVALTPDDPHSHSNLAIIHYDRLELDDVIACAERAVALDPALAGAHFELAEALLLRGDFARGWEEYEWRFKLPGSPQLLPATERPQWDGAPLGSATLLLVADQGYGDTIQFARYIPWAAQRCPNLAVACSPEMQPVVAQQHAALRLIDRWENCSDFAAYCPLSGLPRLHGTCLDTIPAALPYVRSDGVKAAQWGDRLDGWIPREYRRVGIVWAGRPTHQNDRRRSLPLAAFAPLAALPRVALVALQKSTAQNQVGGYFGQAPLLNLGPEISDFADTMAILGHLDLVITVDTAVAHLAGAMGKTAWVLLPYAPDWRWLLGRDDSPWYPTLRLFRQPAPCDWQSVVAAVAVALGTITGRA